MQSYLGTGRPVGGLLQRRLQAHKSDYYRDKSQLHSGALSSGKPNASQSNNATTYSGPSTFVTMIGTLNALKDCIECPVITHLIATIQVDARTWQLLHRPIYDDIEVLNEINKLQDSLYELVKKLNRHSGSGKLPRLLGTPALAEEASFAQKVMSRAASTHKVIQGRITAFHEKLSLYNKLTLAKRSYSGEDEDGTNDAADVIQDVIDRELQKTSDANNPAQGFNQVRQGRSNLNKEPFSFSNALTMAHRIVLSGAIPAPLSTFLTSNFLPLKFSTKIIYRMLRAQLVELESNEREKIARIQAAERMENKKRRKQRLQDKKSWWVSDQLQARASTANTRTAGPRSDLDNLISIHEKGVLQFDSDGDQDAENGATNENELKMSSSSLYLKKGSTVDVSMTNGGDNDVNEGTDEEQVVDDDDSEEDEDDEGKMNVRTSTEDTFFTKDSQLNEILEHESTRASLQKFKEDKQRLGEIERNTWAPHSIELSKSSMSIQNLSYSQYRKLLEIQETFSEEEDEPSVKTLDGTVATPVQIEQQAQRLRELLFRPRYYYKGQNSSGFGNSAKSSSHEGNLLEGTSLLQDANKTELANMNGPKWACGDLTDQTNWVPHFLFPGAVPDVYGIGPIPGGIITPDLLIRTQEDEEEDARALGLAGVPSSTHSASNSTPVIPQSLNAIQDAVTDSYASGGDLNSDGLVSGEELEPEVRFSPTHLNVQLLTTWEKPTYEHLTWLRSHYMTLGLHTEVLRAMWWLYTAAALSQITHQALAVLCEDEANFREAVRASEKAAANAIRSAIPQTAELLKLDPLIFPQNVNNLSFQGVEKGSHYRSVRQFVRELRLAADIYAAADLHLFPSSFQAHRGAVKALSVSRLSPHYVLSGGADGTLRIWDTVTKLCLAQFVGHTSAISWCSFLSLDSTVVSSSLDSNIRIWDSKTSRCLKTLTGHRDSILCCDLSTKQQFLVSASMDCTLRVWVVSSGMCLSLLEGHRNWVTSVKFGSNDQTIVSCGMDQQMLIWPFKGIGTGLTSGSSNSSETNLIQAIISIPIHSERVIDILACPRMRFVSAARDASIFLWKANSLGNQHTAAIAGESLLSPDRASITKPRMRLDGRIDYTSTNALLNEPYTMECSFANPNKAPASSLALSPDKKLVAISMLDCSVNIYELSSGNLLRSVKVHSSGVCKLIFATNRALFLGSTDGFIMVINI